MSSYYLPSESKIGAGYQAHGLAQAMVRAGHDVTMFSPSAKPEDALYHHRLVKVRKPAATFRWALALRRVDLSGFDVFHAAGDDYWFMGKKRPVHVRTMHGSCVAEAFHISGTKERLRMFALGLGEILATLVADRTVLVSENTKKWFPWVKTVIPNGVDLDLFHAADERGKDAAPVILFVGTYRNRKRGKLLLDLFTKEILPAVPDAKLWMVCTDAPEATGVEVLGRLTDAELAERYRRAWVFCLPSTYEGFGVPYIEAMASGTPVVTTRNVGATEVLGDGKFGILCEDEELSKQITSVLADETLRHSIAQDGLRRAQKYAWQEVVKSYEEIYTSLLARPARTSTVTPGRQAQHGDYGNANA